MSRTPLITTTLLLTAALSLGSGCTYIGPDYERDLKELLVDSDGDGEVDTTDCNDNNPNVNRSMKEIPYDGLDNDCSGGDLLDVDGDGYPGISRADWEAQDVDTDNAVWNNDLPADLVDCADDPEANPLAGSIYPNNSNEKTYDGVDSDCGGDNDFDLDRDGYMPNLTPKASGGFEDTETLFNAYVKEWGYTHLEALFDDCDDTNPATNKGMDASLDVWYDGEDTDCSGNNDFDQDGDGYMPALATLDGETIDVTAAFQEFLDRFHNSTVPEGWNVDAFDCVDDPCDSRLFRGETPEDCESGAIVEAGAVFPGADDAWYDGVDADCGQDNDFDQDGDSAMDDTVTLNGKTVDVPSQFQWYTDAWDYSFDEHNPDPVFGDCDDEDASRSPLNIEVLGDMVDQDCVGSGPNQDKAVANTGSYLWSNPRSPQLAWNGQHIALGVMGDALYVDDVFLTDEAGMLFFFDPLTTDHLSGPTKELNWHGFGSAETQQLGDALDMYVDQYGATWISYTYQRWSSTGTFSSDEACEGSPFETNCYTYLMAQEVEYNSEKSAYLSTRYYSSTHNSYYQGTDIDLLVDNNGPWAVACGTATKGADTIPVVKTLRGVGVDDSRSDDLEGLGEVFPGAPADTYAAPAACFFAQEGLPSGNKADFSVCSEEICETFTFNGTSSEITASETVDTWFPSLLAESTNIFEIDRDGMGDGNDQEELYTTIYTSSEGMPYLNVFDENNDILVSFAGDYSAGAATMMNDVLYVATIPGGRSSEAPTLWYGPADNFQESASSVPLNSSSLGDIYDVALLATSVEGGNNTLALALTSSVDGDATQGQVAWAFWELM